MAPHDGGLEQGACEGVKTGGKNNDVKRVRLDGRANALGGEFNDGRLSNIGQLDVVAVEA